jgi:hypothetical protein
MAHAISRRPVATEARIPVRVYQRGICGGQSETGTGFSASYSVSPVNIIPPRFFMYIYHLADGQYARWWPQFRDVVLPHRHDHDYDLRARAMAQAV